MVREQSYVEHLDDLLLKNLAVGCIEWRLYSPIHACATAEKHELFEYSSNATGGSVTLLQFARVFIC